MKVELTADALHSAETSRSMLACVREWTALQDAAARAQLAAATGAPAPAAAAGGIVPHHSVPSKFALRLSHAYTDANLSFTQLKGQDRATVALLQDCKGLSVHLVALTKTENGHPEGCGYEDDHGPMAEVDHTDYEARWMDTDGHVVTKPWTRLRDSEMLDGESVFGEDPDDESYEGYQVGDTCGV